MFQVGLTYKGKYSGSKFEVVDIYRSINGKQYAFGWWWSVSFPDDNPSGAVMNEEDVEEFEVIE